MSIDSQAESDARMDVGAMLGAVVRRWPRIVLVTIALLAVTWGVLQFVPRMYESSAAILVAPRDNTFTRPTGDTGSSTASSVVDPSTMSSQIQLIQSRDTLQQVIDQLHLKDVPEFNGTQGSLFGKLMGLLGRKSSVPVDDVVLNTLYDRLTVIRERDSAVISIMVRAQDPQLAARIATAIASVHVKRQAELSVSDTAEASNWLKAEIDKMRQSVSEAESKVANYRVDNDLFTGSNNTSLSDQQLTDIQNQITAAQGRKNDAKSRADLIRKLLAAGQPTDGVSDIRQSVVVQQLSEEKAKLQGQKAQLLATLLPNHPSVRAIDAQVSEIDKQIAAEGKRVADALDAEARIEADLEASLRADLEKAKQASATAARNGVTLDELQREAKAQRDLLETYLLRYREATSRADANAALPDVRVVTRAAPAVAPASPKTTLMLFAVGFVSLALQVGAIFFGELISGRAIVERRIPRGGMVLEPGFVDEADFTEVKAAELRDRRTLGPYTDEPPSAEKPEETQGEEGAAAAAGGAETLRLRPSRHPKPDDQFLVDPYSRQDVAPPPLPAQPEPPLAEAISNLSADMALGRVRTIMLAGLGTEEQMSNVAGQLAVDADHMGLSIVTVDAGSRQISTEPGITDLALDKASFGEIVYNGTHEGMSVVPWGQQQQLVGGSPRPSALIEALADIFEVVVVSTGLLDEHLALPAFKGEGRLVIVAGDGCDAEAVAAARARGQELGYQSIQVVAPPPERAEVA